MATKYISQGSAGEIQGTTTQQILDAPGAGKCYKITGFSVKYTYNSCNAYFQNTSGTNTFSISSGSASATIGTYGYNNPSGSGNRPDVSWTGTLICPANTALSYNVTRNSSATSGIRNQYYIYLTYETCTAVGAPTTVTLERSGSGKLTLSWSGASNGTGNPIYQYEYFLTSKKGDLSTITHNPGTFPANSETYGSYEFTVSNGNTYYGLVRTVGVLALHSGYVSSTGQSAAFTPTKPSQVTIERAGNGQLKVSWSGAANGTNNAITGYNVRLSTTSGGSAAFSATVSSTSTSGSHTFAVNNNTTEYYAAVRTNGAVYNSGYKWSSSKLAAEYHTKCTKPSTVTLAQDGNGKLKVSWSGAQSGTDNSISSYYVYLSTSSGGSAASGLTATVTTTETSGSKTFTVNNTTTYYAAVRAQGSAGTSYYSDYAWSGGKAAYYYTACTKPSSVTIARDGENKLKVSWSGAAGGTNNAISSYYVFLSTTSGGSAASGFTATVTTTAASGSYTFTTNNTTAYYAAVRTQGAAGSSYYSAYTWSSSSLGAATKCTAPTSVTIARNGDGKLKVTWSGAGGGNNNAISGYDVVLATTSGGTTVFSAAVSSTATGTSTTITTNNGTAYFAGVRTKGGAGSSFYSGYKWSSDKLAAATSCTAPTTVTLAQDGNGKLKVTWSGAGGGTNNAISSYYVFLSTSSGGSAASGLTATVTTTETSGSRSFTVNNTTTYYAAVRTQGAAGSSFYSGYKWSGAKAAYYYTNCGLPGSVSLSRVRGVVTITWTAGSAGTNNSISNYGVIRNTSASATNATSINTAASSGITNSPGAGDFYYGVRTQGSAGSSYYSDYKWSGKITVPSKPSVTAGTAITDTQMDNLRVWINTSGITDIADATKVLASEGNTYKSGLTAGTTKIEASWYNSAADG